MPQQAINARGAHFQTLVVDILHLQYILQLARDFLAVVDRDGLRLQQLPGICLRIGAGLIRSPGHINKYAQQTAGRAFNLHQIQA